MATAPLLTELMWPDPEIGPWLIQIWWRAQHGVPTPVGISLRGWITDDENEVSGLHNHLPLHNENVAFPRIDGVLVRSLPVGALLRDSLDQLTTQLEHLDHRRLAEDPDQADWPEEWVTTLQRRWASTKSIRDAIEHGPRGRDLGDDHYREVADVYAAALQSGSKSPTAEVAKHFTVEKSSAAKKVARARQRGFLPPTTRGRLGPLTEEV
ncbi:MAG TPA: hypothetical protein VG650_13410 [Mycobacteriales bacterium]|nr:hypothetical protein [Mycobacteriales bacterium]